MSVPPPSRGKKKKKDNLILYLDILINTKITWNKELAMVTQRLYHSSATTVPSAFQIYFKCLLFSISNAISSVQDSVIPHLQYCNHLVDAYFIHSTRVGWVSGIIRPWIRTEQDWGWSPTREAQRGSMKTESQMWDQMCTISRPLMQILGKGGGKEKVALEIVQVR